MPRFDRMTTLCLSFPLARVLGRARTRVSYPDVSQYSDNPLWHVASYYHINTSPKVFSQQMRWLRHKGTDINLREHVPPEGGTDLSNTVLLRLTMLPRFLYRGP